jgi:hypothetical protein
MREVVAVLAGVGSHHLEATILVEIMPDRLILISTLPDVGRCPSGHDHEIGLELNQGRKHVLDDSELNVGMIRDELGGAVMVSLHEVPVQQYPESIAPRVVDRVDKGGHLPADPPL